LHLSPGSDRLFGRLHFRDGAVPFRRGPGVGALQGDAEEAEVADRGAAGQGVRGVQARRRRAAGGDDQAVGAAGGDGGEHVQGAAGEVGGTEQVGFDLVPAPARSRRGEREEDDAVCGAMKHGRNDAR